MAATYKKPSHRTPASLKPSKASMLKALYRKSGRFQSMKDWIRSSSAPNSAEFVAAAADWLHNKRANTSKPELCIGKTRRKKGGDKKKDGAAATKK